MAMTNQQQFEFINGVGFEAFQLIVKRLEALGPLPFDDVFGLVLGASAVCAANAVGPVLEQSASPQTADTLTQEIATQVRTLLERQLAARDV
jgi:hypothetical protein